MNNLPPLKQWLIKTHKYTKTKNYTHLLLDNGKLHIDENTERDFLMLYANDVENGYKHYICEIKTPIFKLFSDLDFFDIVPLSELDLIKYMTQIQFIISDFFKTQKELDTKVIVCTTDSKITKIEGADYIKTGIHLIWPFIFVSKPTAFLLRNCLIQNLELTFGSRPSYNSWNDVVDLTVYEQNGLRMIGSHKMVECSICKKSKRKLCGKDNCIALFNSQRKIDEGRPYLPTLVLNHLGKQQELELAKMKSNILYTIIQTSIRTNLSNETPYTSPIWFRFTDINTKIKKKKVLSLPTMEDHIGIKELNPKQRIADSDMRLLKVQEFIKHNLPEPYKKTIITDLILCENDTYVAQTDSKFCMNIDREHNSNHIYFCINKTDMYQKCFCRCDTTIGRKFGLCQDYKSAPRKITINIQKLLFPSSYQKTLTSQDFSQFISHPSDEEQLDLILNNLENDIFGKSSYESNHYH